MLLSQNLKNKFNFPLLIVILIAAFLRIYCLSTIPNGFHQDEAAAGYDAYSLLKTLHTQYGQFLPLFSQTYNEAVTDYDESYYRFLIIPFISIFGLNEFTTRLPAALAGTLNILTLYYLVKEGFNPKLAIISAFFLAICPWHIQLSRVAFRGIFFPCLFCLALFLFFKGLKKPIYLPLSSGVFGICLYSYTSARVFVPLFLLGLVWLFRKQLLLQENRLYVGLSILIFSLIFVALFSFWVSPQLMRRTDKEICLACILKNPLYYGLQYLVYYLSYFYTGYLFLGHVNRGTSQGGILFLFIDLITISFGLFFLKREKNQYYYFLLLWLFLYPIPSALTKAADNVRSIIGIPAFSILAAYGVIQLEILCKGKTKKIVHSAIISLLTASFIIFFSNYFIGYSRKPPRDFQYGLREAITYAERSPYHCIVMSDRFRRPNTMIIFYTQYPPNLYQRSPIEAAVRTNFSIGKYQVISIANTQALNQQCLFIIKPDEIQAIEAKGYTWQNIHLVKKPTKGEAIKLIEVRKK